jgi:hypothetical protein
VKAVQNFPICRSVKDVRSFLGLASFYLRLVPHFADIAKPLKQLIKKETMGLEWRMSGVVWWTEELIKQHPCVGIPRFQSTIYINDRCFYRWTWCGPIPIAGRHWHASELDTLADAWAKSIICVLCLGKNFLWEQIMQLWSSYAIFLTTTVALCVEAYACLNLTLRLNMYVVAKLSTWLH